MSKTAIVYYSLEGTTKAAAEKIGEITGGTLIQLKPEKEPPKTGFKKMAVGGLQAVLQLDPKLPQVADKLADYDKVIIAYPVWAGTYPPAIGAFIDQGGLLGKKVYLVATSGSGNAAKSFSTAHRKLASVGIQDTLSLKGTDTTGIEAFCKRNNLV